MTSSPLSKYAIDKLGITEWSGGNGSNYYMLLDDERAEELRRMGNVLAVERFIYEEPNREVYPHDLTLGWNQDNYGPIWIPARGATIPLTPENMRLYRRCIEVYEGNRVEELPDGRVLLNGQPAADYTFPATTRPTRVSGASCPKTTSWGAPRSSGCRSTHRNRSRRTSGGTGSAPK